MRENRKSQAALFFVTWERGRPSYLGPRLPLRAGSPHSSPYGVPSRSKRRLRRFRTGEPLQQIEASQHRGHSLILLPDRPQGFQQSG